MMITGMHTHSAHGAHDLPRQLARWAFAVAAAALAVVVAGLALVGIGYAVGGSDAVEDTWIGMTTAVTIYVGLAASLGAFVAGLVAWWRHARTGLWLSVGLFPALVTLLVLAELFVLE
ncbi:MAG: hypothetical protein R2731_13340 [Nocardioides sp.]